MKSITCAANPSRISGNSASCHPPKRKSTRQRPRQRIRKLRKSAAKLTRFAWPNAVRNAKQSWPKRRRRRPRTPLKRLKTLTLKTQTRSEERRVGKEERARGWTEEEEERERGD